MTQVTRLARTAAILLALGLSFYAGRRTAACPSAPAPRLLPATAAPETVYVATTNAKALPPRLKQRAKGTGKPVVGIEITVPETTTVIPQPTTSVTPDSARVASVAYHAEWASVEGTVTAPPGNAPIEVDLRLTRRAFTPLIGVYQTKDSTFIDVTGIPGTSTVSKAYAKLNPPVPRLSRTVLLGVSNIGPVAAATVDLRVLGPVGVQALVIGAVNAARGEALGLTAVGARWRW